ncbi:MAG: L-rhamnose mutarotase [Betaproteobacteria bacterium]|nr:MAG: L-rhamnose mutarotase [Betaproteobacteria bacterium]TMH31694.1 MAG: L-rhamnose mutarotase [Betaproteobacteria bacterium]
MRHVLALDLKDDAELIAAYEARHRAVWPEVLEHLRRHGVLGMQIWRLGTRMVMVMSTDDAIYDSQRMRVDTENDPVIRKWEELMWTFQAPTPWTPKGQKWTPMTCVFDVDL